MATLYNIKTQESLNCLYAPRFYRYRHPNNTTTVYGNLTYE